MSKQKELKQVRHKASKNHACSVLITCDKPDEDGSMQVNMTYEGDLHLASFLIRDAQTLIDEKIEERF